MTSAGDAVWSRIEIVRGDITRLAVDAVVNAANETLLGGGGVDGAIHRAAGPDLLAECKTLNGCATGSAKVTRGYRLVARYVIHTVGPVYRDGKSGEPEKLRSCYRESFERAREHEVRTMAFPAISCGVYGYPIEDATRIALSTAADCLQANDSIERVSFVFFSESDRAVGERILTELRGE